MDSLNSVDAATCTALKAKFLARYELKTSDTKRMLDQCVQRLDKAAASFFGRVDEVVQ